MSQKFIIPPRTTDGNEIRKFFVNICQYINRMMEVDNSLARVTLSTNQDSVSSATPTKVLLDTEDFDTGNNFSSYKYTFPVDGKYHVDFGATLLTSGNHLYLGVAYLYLDGVIHSQGNYQYGTLYSSVRSTGGAIVDATAGQYAELWGYGITDSGTFSFVSGVDHSYMSVHLVARA